MSPASTPTPHRIPRRATIDFAIRESRIEYALAAWLERVRPGSRETAAVRQPDGTRPAVPPEVSFAVLKPQDVVVLLKIVVRGPAPWSYGALALDLGMSASEVHAGVRRAVDSGLLHVNEGWGVPDAAGLDEFLVSGVRYVWPAVLGGMTLGMPTAAAAAPLNGLLPAVDDPPTVWPDAGGNVRGIAFEPLYRCVPAAAGRDPALYEMLALVDAIRAGPDRARDVAVRQLRRRLGTDGKGVLSNLAESSRHRRVSAQPSTSGHHGKERQRLHR